MTDLTQYERERDRIAVLLSDGYMTPTEYRAHLLQINRSEARAIAKATKALAKAEAEKYAAKVKRVSRKILRRALHRSLSRYEDVPHGL